MAFREINYRRLLATHHRLRMPFFSSVPDASLVAENDDLHRRVRQLETELQRIADSAAQPASPSSPKPRLEENAGQPGLAPKEARLWIDEAAQRNETLFSSIIQQAPGGVYVVDDQFRLMAINDLGRPTFAAAEPVIGRDFAEIMRILWGEVLGGKVVEIFRRTRDTGERYVSPRFVEERQDLGSDKSYAWETQRITLPNGNFGVVCYFTDTTEQHQLEEALRASEQRAVNIVQSIADGFITMDLDWRITYLNARGEEILRPLQKTHSSVIGKIFWEEFPPTLGTPIEENFRRAMREKVTVQFETYYPPLASWFDVRVYSSSSGVSLYFLDITERKQADEALRASEKALERQATALRQADRSKDEFLAMLAHELRNPLAPLRNATEILQAPESSVEDREQAHEMLGRQIENMSRMIDDLLDVSRITEGKITLRKKTISLHTIMKAAASLVQARCGVQQQTLEVVIPREPIFLHADATRLEQVLGNLLGNACKYSGQGAHIELTATRDLRDGGNGVSDLGDARAQEVIIQVRDNGAGIDPDLLPRVFDLFVQASRTLDRAHGGLGIGLTLVKRLVALHGGSIEARSDGLGQGAAFVIRLPTVTPPPALDTAPPRDRPVSKDVSRRILIVDDNIDAARSLSLLQTRRGHVTETAFTGPDGLRAAAAFLPEVVLLDIGLPGMDGFEVARQIRKIPAMKNTLIIATSGYCSEQDQLKATLAGFDEYLAKPADLELLRTWLRTRGPGVLSDL